MRLIIRTRSSAYPIDMSRSIDAEKYWTGLADVTSRHLPSDVKGAIYRVLTYAADCDAFVRKVSKVLSDSGDTLSFMEEPELLAAFLSHEWVEKDHEIFGMMITAEKSKDDVVCGDPEYYSFDDA